MATTSFQPSYSADIPLYRPLWTPPVFDIYPNDKPKVLCIRLFARERYTNKTSVYQGLRKVAVEALCHENNVGECTLQYGPWQRSGEYVSKEGEWQRGIFDAVRFCTDYNLANGTKYPIHIMLFDFMSPTVAEEVGPWMEGGKELNLPLDWTILCDSVSRVNVASLDIFTFDLKKLRGLTSQKILEGTLMTPNLPEGVQAPPLPCYVWRYENLRVPAPAEAPVPNEPTKVSTSRKRKAKVVGVAKPSKKAKTAHAPEATQPKPKRASAASKDRQSELVRSVVPIPTLPADNAVASGSGSHSTRAAASARRVVGLPSRSRNSVRSHIIEPSFLSHMDHPPPMQYQASHTMEYNYGVGEVGLPDGFPNQRSGAIGGGHPHQGSFPRQDSQTPPVHSRPLHGYNHSSTEDSAFVDYGIGAGPSARRFSQQEKLFGASCHPAEGRFSPSTIQAAEGEAQAAKFTFPRQFSYDAMGYDPMAFHRALAPGNIGGTSRGDQPAVAPLHLSNDGTSFLNVQSMQESFGHATETTASSLATSATTFDSNVDFFSDAYQEAYPSTGGTPFWPVDNEGYNGGLGDYSPGWQ